MGPKPRSPAEQLHAFWSRTERMPSGCCEWRGAIGTHGYGVLTLSQPRRHVTAHRFAWESTHGPIPAGLFVCHTCDNRTCCNPIHLFLGTAADNSADADAKGRLYKDGAKRPARGGRHYNAKLTDAQVAEIRALGANGSRNKDLAARFGVSKSRISMITNLRSRTHG